MEGCFSKTVQVMEDSGTGVESICLLGFERTTLYTFAMPSCLRLVSSK